MKDLWISRFQREALPVLAEEFKPQKIISFGSRVQGETKEDSDLDVISISSSFRNILS